MEKIYKIIDKKTNKCINSIVWDGISPWQKPSDCEVIQDEAINMQDEVVLTNSKWVKVEKEVKHEESKPVETQGKDVGDLELNS